MQVYAIRPLIAAFFVAIAAILAPIAANAQDTVEIGIEDLKQLRRLAADRDFQTARAEAAEREAAGWKDSAANWKTLYEAEKDRADRVQGGRIAELAKANEAYRQQAEADKQRLGELEFRIRKLKGQRKWFFAAGAAAGAIGGYQIAKFSF